MSNTVHNRRSIRLPGYDYSQAGAYFVTVVTQNRLSLFGEIQNADMILNEIGEMVEGCWLDLSRRYPMIDLDEFIIMPNHIHGIIIITDEPVGPSVVVDQPKAGVGPTLVVDQPGAGVGPTLVVDQPGAGVGPTLVVDQPEAGVGVTLVVDQSGAGTRPAPTNPTLGDMMMAFKSITTHEYIIGVKQSSWPPFEKRIWQRNYYEHIIRSEEELLRVRDYINSNPLRWDLDEENLQKG